MLRRLTPCGNAEVDAGVAEGTGLCDDTDMPSHAELLKAYLADRDVPCPGCGYSLKGCVADKCPECGHKPSLAIHHTFWTVRRVVLLRTSLCIFAIAYLLSSADWAYTLSFRAGFTGMGWYVISGWILAIGGGTIASMFCFWAFWQTRRARRSHTSEPLNRAFTTAMAVPSIMLLMYIIQAIIAEFI